MPFDYHYHVLDVILGVSNVLQELEKLQSMAGYIILLLGYSGIASTEGVTDGNVHSGQVYWYSAKQWGEEHTCCTHKGVHGAKQRIGPNWHENMYKSMVAIKTVP